LGVQPGPPGANPFCPCGIERGAARGRKAVVLGDAARWQKSGGPSTTVAHGRKIARFLSGGVGPVRGCPMRNTDKTRTAVARPCLVGRRFRSRHALVPHRSIASQGVVATASPSSFLMSLRPAGAGWRDDHSSQTSEWIRRETRPLSSRCNDHSSQPRDPLRTGTWISLRIRPYHHLRVPEQDRETRTWCVSW